MKKSALNEIISQFIKSTNDFNIEKALTLFAKDAVIDDVSVGETFKNTKGVRHYLEKFFVGYKTVTKLESVEIINDLNANAKVDFTGNFGHETGALNFTFTTDGLIKNIHAYLD